MKKKTGSKKQSIGFKMPKQRAVGPKKPEPDDKMFGKQNQKLGGAKAANPGSTAASKSARMKRLSGVRL